VRKREFIGKPIDLLAGGELGFCSQDDDYQSLEIGLSDYETGMTDKAGFTGYTLTVVLDDVRVVDIYRTGHCHMCGGQGTDSDLRRFPHASLEDEAAVVLESLLTSYKEATDLKKKRVQKDLRKKRQEEKARRKSERDELQARKKRYAKRPWTMRAQPAACIGKPILTDLIKAIVSGRPGVDELVSRGIEESLSPEEIFEDGLLGGCKEYLYLDSMGERYFPETLSMRRSLHCGLDELRRLCPDFELPTNRTAIVAPFCYGWQTEFDIKCIFECFGYRVIPAQCAWLSPDGNISHIAEEYPGTVVCLWSAFNPVSIQGNSRIATSYYREAILRLRKSGVTNPLLVGDLQYELESLKDLADGWFWNLAAAVLALLEMSSGEDDNP